MAQENPAAEIRELKRKLREARQESRERLEQMRERVKNREGQLRVLRTRLEECRMEGELDAVDRFHKLYYDARDSGGTWFDTYWMGVPTWKCPLDLWVYQEIIFDRKPDVIVETGTAYGGSALFLACMCDLAGKGRVVTIDLEEQPDRPRHERITYLSGSSTSEGVLSEVGRIVGDGEALVILDSDHARDHVLAELEAYAGLVRNGGYLVVEDTNVNGHPVLSDFGPGPMEAVQEFLEKNESFVADEGKEKFFLTFNPGGYLKKVGASERRTAEEKPEAVLSRAFKQKRSPTPENIVWIFGHGRTGSTWLSRMMQDAGENPVWFEPCVGELFGNLYYLQSRAVQRESKNWIMGGPQKETWRRSIRSFVLEGAGGRYPRLGEERFLIIKEPHGSIGAPLLMEALPESRIVLLTRDPRDSIASSLDAFREGNWAHKHTGHDEREQVELATNHPEAFVEMKAKNFLRHMGNAKRAYDDHEGPKVLVRYEDLRTDTLGTMRRIHSELGMPVDEAELSRAVEKHSWENVPEEKKGEGMFYRKARPGSWREDLTEDQIRIVERITAPLFAESYSYEEGFECQS